MPTRLDRIKGALVGGAVGDMLGAPYEMKSREEVQAMLAGGPLTMAADARATDDTQLTLVVLESLIACHGFDILDMARRHVLAYEQSTQGWGGTTKAGIREIKRWFETGGREGRALRTPRPWRNKAKGGGNGVAMKIAPLAIFYCLAFDHERHGAENRLLADTMKLGRLTPPDSRASFLAARFGQGIMFLLDEICRTITRDGDRRMLFLESVIVTPEFEQVSVGTANFAAYPDGSAHGRLALLLDVVRCCRSADEVRTTLGTSCYAMESVPFAIATFLRHPTDFRAAMREAITAGGDTDTIAAMVGTLVGANVGLEGIPEDWRAHDVCTLMAAKAEQLALAAVGLI